jgi:hypothetical protein
VQAHQDLVGERNRLARRRFLTGAAAADGEAAAPASADLIGWYAPTAAQGSIGTTWSDELGASVVKPTGSWTHGLPAGCTAVQVRLGASAPIGGSCAGTPEGIPDHG